MTLKSISTPPDPTTFTTLEDHQASTPATFTSEVLHFKSSDVKLAISSDQKYLLPTFFPDDATSNDISIPEIETTEEAADGDEDWEDEDAGPLIQDATLEGIDIYVTTKKLVIYSTSLNTGYEILYPSITLHAITSTPTTSGIYMQINTSDSTFDDHDYTSLEITIYPPQTTLTTSAPASITASTQELYKALTDCSNLHPDQKGGFFANGDGDDDEEYEEGAEGGDDDGIIYLDHGNPAGGISFIGGANEVGGIPALAPGGWITAENVDSIQWTIDGQSGVGDPNNASLGPGAGNVRRRDDDDITGQDAPASGPEVGDGTETKWRRTD